MRIVRIEAVWCPGCLVMKGIWNKIYKKYTLNVTELDYDMDNLEVSKYNVGNILPVVIFLDDSFNELDRIVGETTEKVICEYIEKYR